jgi:hypothetical protein
MFEPSYEVNNDHGAGQVFMTHQAHVHTRNGKDWCSGWDTTMYVTAECFFMRKQSRMILKIVFECIYA